MGSHPFTTLLQQRSQSLNHFVCLGLDPDPAKLPAQFSQDLNGCAAFLEAVIKETQDHVLCYKPNMAFFEAFGIEGLKLLESVRSWIPSSVPLILDAKRADIGNTSQKLATYVYDYFGADSVTLHPYMGSDSLLPFFEYKDKFNFVLALTSNPSAKEFECYPTQDQQPLYTQVIKKSQEWLQTYNNVGVVVGATQRDELATIRNLAPELLYLMPGVGAQGAGYKETVADSLNSDGLVVVNMTRSILYGSTKASYLEEMRNSLEAFSL